MKIYHSKTLALPFEDMPESPRYYNEVAEINASDLNEAYILSQNFETSWLKNKKVKTNLTRCRSTSVGDVIEDRGKYFIVEMVGFSEIKKLKN